MFNTIGCLGDGAIGSLFAGSALTAGIKVDILLRDPAKPQRTCIFVDVNGNEHPFPPATCADSASVDLLVIPLKVHQLNEAFRQWRDYISEDTTLILLQNGMGGEQITRRWFPEHRLYLATTTHGALKQSQKVYHTGIGITAVGSLNTETEKAKNADRAVLDTLSRCFPPVSWQDDIRLAQWQKLAINAVINPLTALHNIKNGALAAPTFHRDINAITDEVAKVMKASGFPVDIDGMRSQIANVIHHTADNYSSMHQDVLHHRPTEIDAITGYILAQAKKFDLSVPHNQQLYDKLQSLSQ